MDILLPFMGNFRFLRDFEPVTLASSIGWQGDSIPRAVTAINLDVTSRRYLKCSRIKGASEPHVRRGSKAQLRKPGMIVGAPPKRPVILPIRFLNGNIIDAGEPALHQSRGVILPMLVSV